MFYVALLSINTFSRLLYKDFRFDSQALDKVIPLTTETLCTIDRGVSRRCFEKLKYAQPFFITVKHIGDVIILD